MELCSEVCRYNDYVLMSVLDVETCHEELRS